MKAASRQEERQAGTGSKLERCGWKPKAEVNKGLRAKKKKGCAGWRDRREVGQGRVWEVDYHGEECRGKREARGYAWSESPVIALTLSQAEVLLSQREWWIPCPQPRCESKVTARRDFCLWALWGKTTKSRQYQSKDVWVDRLHRRPGKMLNGRRGLEVMLQGQTTKEAVAKKKTKTKKLDTQPSESVLSDLSWSDFFMTIKTKDGTRTWRGKLSLRSRRL